MTLYQIVKPEAAGTAQVENYVTDVDGRKAIELEMVGEATCEVCQETKSDTYNVVQNMFEIPVCRECIESFDYTIELVEINDTLAPEEIAAQTAEDAKDEFGVNTAVVGSNVLVNDPEDKVISRNLLGYCDTSADDEDMDFTYEVLSGNEECGHTGEAYKITYF